MKFLQGTSNLFRAAVCALILAVLWDVTAYGAACQTLPDEVLRLHVVAASDSEEDQALKLAVRDEVLEVVASLGTGAQTPFEMQSALCTHLETIQKAAEDVIRQQGHREAVQVFFVDMSFPDCVYGGFGAAGRHISCAAGRDRRRAGAQLVVHAVPGLCACRKRRWPSLRKFSARRSRK